VEAHSTVPII